MTKALIIVDVQPTFCEGDELGVDGGNAVAERIAAYVDAHRDDYAYLATTQDWHIEPGAHWSDDPDYVDTWPRHGVAGTPNADLHTAVRALDIPHHFKKGQYSAAYSGFEGIEDDTERVQSREEFATLCESGATLAQALADAGVADVDVVGIAESHCVKETALDAVRLGYRVTVFEDLTVPVSEDLGVVARAQMAAAGIRLADSTATAVHTVHVEPLSADRYEQKADVQSRTWHELNEGRIPQEIVDAITPQFALELTRRHADDPSQTTLVAVDGDQVVGFIELLATPREPMDRPGAAELASLYVLADHHSRGIGRMLVEAGVRAADDGRLALWVAEFNGNAQGFYRRMGFRFTGVTQDEDFGRSLEMINY